MLPKYHIILGFFFSSLLFVILPSIGLLNTGVIFLSSFLIDIDHYLLFVVKKRNLNPKKAVEWFFKKKEKYDRIPVKNRNNFYSGFYFLHGFELLVILFLFGLFLSDIFFFILSGFIFHLFLDVLENIFLDKRIDKISIIYDFVKFRKLKEIE
jgi:hypothetical protein